MGLPVDNPLDLFVTTSANVSTPASDRVALYGTSTGLALKYSDGSIAEITAVKFVQSFANSATGAQAQIVVPAPGAGKRLYIPRVSWSYDQAFAGGRVSVLSGATEIMGLAVTTSGNQRDTNLIANENEAVSAILLAPTAGIVANINMSVMEVEA